MRWIAGTPPAGRLGGSGGRRRYHVKDSRRDDPPAPTERRTPDDGTRPPKAPLDPIAGTHGVPPHAPRRVEEDPAAEEARKETTVDRLDPSLEAPALRPAVLGRLEGLGLITMVRDAAGALLHTEGTWRPADETATLDELRETFPEGSVTTFAGAMVEPRHDAPPEDVSMQVVIKRHGEYEDEDGRMLRVVNFVTREEAEPATHRDVTPPRI
jgi:hypothetical protein